MNINELDQNNRVIESLDSFCSNKVGFLLLSGMNGTGKTFSALAVYYQFTPYKLPYRNEDFGLFITQAELNIQWSDENASKNEILNTLKNTPMLVIDDIGTRVPTDAFMDFLYALIDYRWMNRKHKATVITTNLNASQMRERFGEAFFSRVASGVSIVFEGRDRRFDDSKCVRNAAG